MTQLFIDGTEAVLPQNFSVTVKRENPFFTKSGEYTYDCQLRLDNPINLQLFGFLNRTNNSDQISTDRTAILIADGHVYCRGKEIVTRWTEETVCIQIVSGESELNFFIGQDRKVEELELGEADGNCCVYPVVRTPAGGLMNYRRVFRYKVRPALLDIRYERKFMGGTYVRIVPSPLLCPLLERLIGAMGYTVERNDLADTAFSKLFILNYRNTTNIARMLAGWTVKDFLVEVERLTGVVFITDNLRKTCSIIPKQTFYLEARQLTLGNVVDNYETEVEDDESREAEFTTSNVAYSLPDHRWSKLMKLPEGLPTSMETRNYSSLGQISYAAQTTDVASPVLMRDTSTGRLYICSPYTNTNTENEEMPGVRLREVDQFTDLDRQDTESQLELRITPAPMAYLGWPHDAEVIDLGTTDGYDGHYVGWSELVTPSRAHEGDEEEWEVVEDDTVEQHDTFEDTIRAAQKKESSASDLYCAFWGGYTTGGTPIVYTDAYHARVSPLTVGSGLEASDFLNLEGSLRLKDLDTDYYQGGYEIDTRHAVTFDTFDPNVIDTRQVYVVRNRRYVVRDVEETVTAEGRSKMWRITCFPINVSDEAILKRWVLTRGVWDDGAAWLDDGRWNDNPI